jgi:hypothetical protein
MEIEYDHLIENGVVADSVSEAIDEAKRDAEINGINFKGFVVIKEEPLPSKTMYLVAALV